jgi:hypothetical protein
MVKVFVKVVIPETVSTAETETPPDTVEDRVSIDRVPDVVTLELSRVRVELMLTGICSGITRKVPNIADGWMLHLYVQFPAAGIFEPMTGVKVKLRNESVELKVGEAVAASFESTMKLLLKSRNQLWRRLSSLFNMIETRSPLTTDMKGPGLVSFQLNTAFPLSQKVLWTGLLDNEMRPAAGRAVETAAGIARDADIAMRRSA